MIVGSSICFITNHPKGFYYEVPSSDAFFNIVLGLFILFIYLLILLVSNIYLYKKFNVSATKYILLIFCEFIIGTAFFFLAMGDRTLF